MESDDEEVGVIETGVVVHLNSGGPAMTVVGVGGGLAECCWFVKGEPCFEDFPRECLTICEGYLGGVKGADEDDD